MLLQCPKCKTLRTWIRHDMPEGPGRCRASCPSKVWKVLKPTQKLIQQTPQLQRKKKRTTMTSRDFAYWLQGFFEITSPNGETVGDLNHKQVSIIKKHLDMVFEHEIDPSFPDRERLEAIHNEPSALTLTREELKKLLEEEAPKMKEELKKMIDEHAKAVPHFRPSSDPRGTRIMC